jgi:hypothetical protein
MKLAGLKSLFLYISLFCLFACTNVLDEEFFLEYGLAKKTG